MPPDAMVYLQMDTNLGWLSSTGCLDSKLCGSELKLERGRKEDNRLRKKQLVPSDRSLGLSSGIGDR